jgi:hypothetical protein
MDQPSEAEKKRPVGQCAYLLVTLFSTAAFICGLYANAFCDFASREVEFVEGFDLAEACADLRLTGSQEQICNTLFTNHGVGFYGWYATVPVDEQVCLSYTVWNPNAGYVTPEFDTKFNSARAFAITANVLGAFAWFTLMLASCCPITQGRLKALSFYFFPACLFQGLSLLIFKSDICTPLFFAQYFPNQDLDEIVSGVTCSLGRGSKLAISATVLYFVSNMLTPIAIAPSPIGYSMAAPAETAARDAEQDETGAPAETAGGDAEKGETGAPAETAAGDTETGETDAPAETAVGDPEKGETGAPAEG